MLPAAPATFSMPTDGPSDRCMRSAMMRANTSAGPPAANGTIMLTGRVGKAWARPIPESVGRTAPPAVENDVAQVSLSFHSCGVATGGHSMVVCNSSRRFASAKSIDIVAATPDVDAKAQFKIRATLVPRAVAKLGIRRERACAKNVCCCYCVRKWSPGEDGDATIYGAGRIGGCGLLAFHGRRVGATGLSEPHGQIHHAIWRRQRQRHHRAAVR